MTTNGAPLKPWELARSGQRPPEPLQETPAETSAEDKDCDGAGQGVIHTTRPTPTYTPHSYYNTSYVPPYTAPRSPYGGGSYYGYPSTYGTTTGTTGMYGSSYGVGTQYGTGYGGMYSYGRPSPWTQQPLQPPGMPMHPGGDAGPQKTPMWQRFLDALTKIVTCFGRVTFLVDESTQAFHFLITALLAFLDKAGSLYGEIARYVLKLLGFGRYSKKNRGIASTSTGARKSVTGSALRNLWNKQ